MTHNYYFTSKYKNLNFLHVYFTHPTRSNITSLPSIKQTERKVQHSYKHPPKSPPYKIANPKLEPGEKRAMEKRKRHPENAQDKEGKRPLTIRSLFRTKVSERSGKRWWAFNGGPYSARYVFFRSPPYPSRSIRAPCRFFRPFFSLFHSDSSPQPRVLWHSVVPLQLFDLWPLLAAASGVRELFGRAYSSVHLVFGSFFGVFWIFGIRRVFDRSGGAEYTRNAIERFNYVRL